MRVIEEFLDDDVAGANRWIKQNRIERMRAHRRKTIAAENISVSQIVGFEVLLRQLRCAKVDVAGENLCVQSSTRYEAGDGTPAATQIANGFRVRQVSDFEQNARAFIQVAARENAVAGCETQRLIQARNFDLSLLKGRFIV